VITRRRKRRTDSSIRFRSERRSFLVRSGIIHGVGSGWLIDGAVVRGVTSAEAWNGYGFSWDNKRWISQEMIDAMPKGEYVTSDNLAGHLDVDVK
jgi:hypothetical protein